MRPRTIVSIAFLLVASFVSVSTEAQLTPALSRNVNDAVVGAKAVAREVGVHIVDLASGEDVYAYRADNLHIVASNAKLATTAAALERLGPGYFIETSVLSAGEIDSRGRLEGDLAVVGGGDPNLSGRHHLGDPYGPFREWAAALRARGVRHIVGDIVLVHGLFDDQTVHPDWPTNQLDRWYEAPVEALSFSDNCVLVKVSPARSTGAPAAVETVPDLARFRVRSTAKTIGSAGSGVRIARGGEPAVLEVHGQIRRGADSVDRWVAVRDPVGYFGAALIAALAEEGIAVEGRARATERLPPAAWQPVTVHRSDLLTTLEVVNKRSQNFYAESVLKLLGARHCGEGSWRGGLSVIAEFLAEIGIAQGTYTMADGSGMSRNNRFTPRQMTTLLSSASLLRHGDAFLRTLPISGERGLSWAKRLAEPPYRGNVLAKTGTLKGVSTLSGIAKGRTGRRYVFSILLNAAGPAWRSKSAQDAIVRALIDHG